jgi:hypothetical protein
MSGIMVSKDASKAVRIRAFTGCTGTELDECSKKVSCSCKSDESLRTASAAVQGYKEGIT